MTDLTAPAAVLGRLGEIEQDLAARQNALERAAMTWFRVKREREHQRARAFMQAQGTVAERNAQADIAIAAEGSDSEAEYEALKAVVRVLDTRANIGMALLKAQGRFGSAGS